MFLKVAYLVPGLLAFAVSAAAEPVLWECKVDSREDIGWISERMFVEIDQEAGKAGVLDNAIYSVIEREELMPVTYRGFKRGKHRLSWSFNNLRTSAGVNIRVGYTVELDPKKNEIVVQGYQGYMPRSANKPRGRGNCKTIRR